jgi:phosphate transport system substrate-binding protein
MVIAPIAVVYNLPGAGELRFSPATLAGMFGGTITRWNDPAIAADNPDVPLPSTTITAVHRTDPASTTETFTGYLEKAAGPAWTNGAGQSWKAGAGVGVSGSDRLITAVKQTAGAIGYTEWTYARNAELPPAKIRNGNAEYVTLSAEAAARTVQAAANTAGSDPTLVLDVTTREAGAYPLVRVTYEVVCAKGNAAGKLPLLKGFLGYAVSAVGQGALAELELAPLPEPLRAKVDAAVKGLA